MMKSRFHEKTRTFYMLGPANKIGLLIGVGILTACGEPAFENAGSQNSLIEDREACVTEIDSSPAANEYRQNPDAHPEYLGEVFNAMNRCIERKGWKQVRSDQEQDQLREAIAKAVTQKTPPSSISDSRARESLARALEPRFSLRNEPKKADN